jgi:hypothetical protein
MRGITGSVEVGRRSNLPNEIFPNCTKNTELTATSFTPNVNSALSIEAENAVGQAPRGQPTV